MGISRGPDRRRLGPLYPSQNKGTIQMFGSIPSGGPTTVLMHIDHDLGLFQRVEDLAVEQLVTESGIEAFDVTVLPRRAGLDEGRPGSDRGDPAPDGLGDELRAVVGPDESRGTAQDEQVGQHVDHVGRRELAADPDRQALPGELVQSACGRRGHHWSGEGRSRRISIR